MRKIITSIIALFVCVILSFAMVACTNNAVTPPDSNIPDTNRPSYDGATTLVVYFSQPDNVDDSTVEIDGETLGNTQYMAYVIQENTGANIFRIIPQTPYPIDHDELVDLASDEKANNARPAISDSIENFEQYDTVFVGYPNWWGDMPMILYTFFDTYDFSGKTIIPFNTHGGSGFSGTGSTIRGLEPNAMVLNGLSISRNSIQDAEQEIIEWVQGLGFEKPDVPVTPDNPDVPEQPEIPEPTASLEYELNENETAYIVTGIADDEENIVIPAEYAGLPVTTLGESSFAYSRHNEDIFSVTIPDSVTTIERNAFSNRDEMTTVNLGIGSNLATIANGAFSGNGALENIYIPSGVTSIGDNSFNNTGAIDFTVAKDNPVYRSENGHLIETATNTLIRGGQNGEIPEGVTAIAQAAFRQSTNITELVIPVSITVIGNYFIADSSIITVRYMGTEEEWNEIEKTNYWNFGNREVELLYKTEQNILIVYFTAERGNTENLANYIHSQVGGDIVQIQAAQPYTAQELNYSIENNRPEVEKAENARPEIAAVTYDAIDMSKYDTVFIGYPIWWWTAPMIIGTFLEHYDLTGIDIYPFSQSASMNGTQFETSVDFVRECAAVNGTPTVHDGLFARASSTSTIDAYLAENGLI